MSIKDDVKYAKHGSPAYGFRHASGWNTAALAAATVLEAEDMRGQVYFLDAAGGFQITLPAPALGLNAEIIVKTPVTSTGYTIVTAGGANIMVVSVNELETDSTEDGPSDDDADLVTLVANLAVAGDCLRIRCDGTKWYLIGQTRLDGAVTTATT